MLFKILLWLFKGKRFKRDEVLYIDEENDLIKEDSVDERDFIFSSSQEPMPRQVLLRIPEVKNQGNIGSCGSHAFMSAYEIMNPNTAMSELYHYYKTREMAGTLPNDNGMTLRDGARAFKTFGSCIEFFWKYNPKYFNTKPNAMADKCAQLFKINSYYRILQGDVDSVKQALHNGIPAVGGWQLFKSFYYYNPTAYQKGVYGKEQFAKTGGKHAMVITGFCEDRQAFRVLNSWGRNWGENDMCWISYKYFKDYCFDIWIIN